MVSIDIGKITLPHSNCINYKQTTKKKPQKKPKQPIPSHQSVKQWSSPTGWKARAESNPFLTWHVLVGQGTVPKVTDKDTSLRVTNTVFFLFKQFSESYLSHSCAKKYHQSYGDKIGSLYFKCSYTEKNPQ